MNEQSPVNIKAEETRRRFSGPGLSAKLLFLTILFVMIAEVLVFVPSVSNFRHQWLKDRLAAAQIAALAAEAAPGGELPLALRDDLLMKARVLSIFLRRPSGQTLVMNMGKPTAIDATFDLRTPSWPSRISEALMLFFAPDGRVIRVLGDPGMADGEMMVVVMEEAPLKAAVIRYSLDIFGLSILISVITGTLVYLALSALLVRPMMRITRNIIRFREDPEDPTRIVRPTGRRDEIGEAERALSVMEAELANTLSQKRRLAALGLAVSKISHDLRNMLASAQLLSDRLGGVKDPTVQRVAPKLVASVERAIRLCAQTLAFGQVQETLPERSKFPLKPLVAEVGEGLGLTQREEPDWQVEIDPKLKVDADRDQLFRVLNNLTKNALQSLESRDGGGGRIAISAKREGAATQIEIADNGPGVASRARERLFEPFQSVARKDGVGLGLAIAAELVQAHGGSIALVGNATGATFRITIPDSVPRRQRRKA